jgi:hypothetical protein
MKKFFAALFLLVILVSCFKTPDDSKLFYSFSGVVFVVNEGNYLAGNGSLSVYSYDSSKVYNDLFYSANHRLLGDVPNSMTIHGDKAYIVVNNSGKIEIVNKSTIVSEGIINGLVSPRYMSVVSDSKAYVSSLYSDSVAIISLSDNSISGYINMRRTSESIFVIGSFAYIANWSGGKEVMVVNTINDQVVDSIEVGSEPESMVTDKNHKLWVLCDGGWQKTNYPQLIEIDPASNEVEKTFTFPTKEESPSCLRINGTGQTLFYLDNGVRTMDVDATALSSSVFISQATGQSFYKMAVNPVNDDIFVTDAADYTGNGNILLYNNNGGLVSTFKAGIIPGSMCFKLTITTSKK